MMKLRATAGTVLLLFCAGLFSVGAVADPSPPAVILDTDFRSDVDDAGTLALLNALADNGDCSLLGVMASQTGPWVVGAINAVNTYYGRGHVPIGLSPVEDQRFDDFYAPVIGNPEHYPSTQSNATAPDSTTLYRQLLHAAADQSVIVVVVGGQTCVHRLLLSPADPEGDGSIHRTGRELIASKVRQLVIMGGNFVDPNQREHNIALDMEAAQAVAESWPTPIVYSGFEIGRPVMTGGAYTRPETNPVAKAYELFPAGGVGTIASSSSYDQTALYYAVRGIEANGRTLWHLSDPGWVSFPEARTRFARSAWGRHRHLVRHATDDEVAAVIEALMIQPPKRSDSSRSAVQPRTSTEYVITDYGATPNDDTLDTAAIQAAVDAAARAGGGTVRIPRGRFVSGTIHLRHDVRLFFEDDAVLEGSSDWRHYGHGRWHDALIVGENLRNVRLEGAGTIDGVDCHNPKGEEGFRGPHAIRLNGCRDIVIRDLTIRRAGNYAILALHSTGADLSHLTIRGGHDGLHAQACRDFQVSDCDIRTGDDCFAGADNVDIEIVRCRINSSCNGFRLGAVNLVVRDCEFWGPGEYPHRISARRGTPRTNMLSAFVHFAPADRRPWLPSDNWLIENCRIDNVDLVYGYDFVRGGWQTGQPARRIQLRNVRAERVARPLRVLGDVDRQFELAMENVSIALRDDHAGQEVLHLTQFGALRLNRVTLRNNGTQPVLRARAGNVVSLEQVTAEPANPNAFDLEEINAPQWQEIELTFTAERDAANPYTDFQAWVDFTHEDGTTLRRPMFWDGNRTFRARFASNRSAGAWRWQSASANQDPGLHGRSGTLTATPGRASTDATIFERHGFWSIPSGGRNLIHADGTPRLLGADTPWALPWRATLEQAEVYARDRQAKGYNAALLMTVQPDMKATGPRSRTQDLGFDVGFEDLPEGTLRRLNPEYFQMFDKLAGILVAHGIAPVFQPVFHGYGWKGRTVAGNVVSPEDYARYCLYLVARYGARPAIWLVGGDGPGTAPAILEQLDQAGRTLREWDAYRQPIGIHYSPHALNRTHQDKDWLDFQWCQTGHNGEHVPERVADMWRNLPVKAVANGEPTYENIGRTGRGAGWWQGHEAWLNLTAGGTMGVVYGAASLWQWRLHANEPDHADWCTAPGAGWREALAFAGSRYPGIVAKIFDGLPLAGMEPNWIYTYGRRGLAVPGKLFVLYLPEGGNVAILSRHVPRSYRVFDPRTGEVWRRDQLPDTEPAQAISGPGTGPRVLVFAVE